MQTTSKIITEKAEEMKFDKTVLIVEDDYISYRVLKYIVSKTGAKIIWAQNGAEAIDICEKNPEIDLVFMDISIPEMDGLEATRKIKKIRKELPIIIQTAYTDFKERGIKAGCSDYINKPFNKEIIYQLLQKFMGE